MFKRERSYDQQLLLYVQNENQLNREKRIVHDSVTLSINNNEGYLLLIIIEILFLANYFLLLGARLKFFRLIYFLQK